MIIRYVNCTSIIIYITITFSVIIVNNSITWYGSACIYVRIWPSVFIIISFVVVIIYASSVVIIDDNSVWRYCSSSIVITIIIISPITTSTSVVVTLIYNIHGSAMTNPFSHSMEEVSTSIMIMIIYRCVAIIVIGSYIMWIDDESPPAVRESYWTIKIIITYKSSPQVFT